MKIIIISLLFCFSYQGGIPEFLNNSFEESIMKSLKMFLNSTINYDESKKKCGWEIYSNETLLIIKNYSFELMNNFGDFYNCLKVNNYSYIYLVGIRNKSSFGQEEDDYKTFSNLAFNDYYSISMCIPNCFIFLDNLKLSFYDNEDDYYRFKIYNISEKIIQNDKNNDEEKNIVIINIVLFTIFYFLGLFFFLFKSLPNLKFFINIIFCCCMKKHYKKQHANANLNKSDASKKGTDYSLVELEAISEISHEEVLGFPVIYSIISDIFAFDKNTVRLFKDTGKSNKISRKYINDNLVSFTNGLKAIILIFLNLFLVFYISILSPNNNINEKKLEEILSNYYLFYFIHLSSFCAVTIFPINGFLIAYKFNNFIKFNNSFGIFTIARRFFLRQINSYIIFLFMLILTINLDNLMINIYGLKGPLVSFYPNFTHKVFNEIWYYLSLSVNFCGIESTFFFVKFFNLAVNEFIYFILSLLIICLYSKFKNIIFCLILLIYVFGLSIKSYLISNIKNMNFFEFFNFMMKFEYGFSLYIIGIIFGIFYFEHFYCDLNKTFDSFDSSSQISVILNKQDNLFITRKIMRFISASNTAQNLITVISFCLLILSLCLDLFYLKLYDAESFKKFKTSDKIYLSIQLDLLVVSLSMILFKFVIFTKTILKKFLEHKIWILSSRSFQMITLLQVPLIYFVIYNVNYSIKFTLVRALFLSCSMIMFTYTVSFLLMIFISVPIKVGIKRLIK